MSLAAIARTILLWVVLGYAKGASLRLLRKANRSGGEGKLAQRTNWFACTQLPGKLGFVACCGPSHGMDMHESETTHASIESSKSAAVLRTTVWLGLCLDLHSPISGGRLSFLDRLQLSS